MSYRAVIVENLYLKDLAGIENGLLPLDNARFALGRSESQLAALAERCDAAAASLAGQGLGLAPGSLSLDARLAVVDICVTQAISEALLETLRAKWNAEAGLPSLAGSADAAAQRDVLDRCEWNLAKLLEFGWVGFKRQTPSLASGRLRGVEGVAAFSLLMSVAADHARSLRRFAADHPDCPWGAAAMADYVFRMDAPAED